MIVILAVIALIATPLIMGTITKAKKNALIDTAYGILKAGENYFMEYHLKNDGEIPYLFIQNLESDDKLVYKGTKPKAGKLMIGGDGKSSIVMWNGQFCATKSYQDSKIRVDEKIHTKEDCMNSSLKTTQYQYTGNSQEFIVSQAGTYLIELWGASGGGNPATKTEMSSKGGAGAYTSGMIQLEKNTKLYLYIGGKGTVAGQAGACDRFSGGGYNGGGHGHCGNVVTSSGTNTFFGYGGGGATDIRLTPGNWDNFESLKSRIMVAGGGGGTDNYDGIGYLKNDDGTGGSGGSLFGENAFISGQQKIGVAIDTTWKIGVGGSQTGGYAFGKGETTSNDYADQAGAGSGYYGGFTTNVNNGGGAGGSSFISGYSGCDAIANNSTESNIVHTGQSNHYSGKVFMNPIMISGMGLMPSPTGTGSAPGNIGHGYARITLVSVN